MPIPVAALILSSAILVSGCGGGGGGASDTPPPPPPPPPPIADVTLSIPDAVSEVKEWQDDTSIEVTVALSQAVNTDVVVTLESSGTALIGGDFDLSENPVTVPGGSLSAKTLLMPIRDFEAEDAETITLDIGAISGDGQLGDAASVSLEIADLGGVYQEAKSRLYSKLYLFIGDPVITQTAIEFSPTMLNHGAVTSEAVRVGFRVSALKNLSDSIWSRSQSAPPISPRPHDSGDSRNSFEPTFSIPLSAFPTSGPYYMQVFADTPNTDAPDARQPRDFGGVVINTSGGVRLTCPDLARNTSPGIEDPLRAQQWNLENTGQAAYADNPGVAGEDLGMTQTLQDGPTGDGVKVAVADTGLEICHPDLEANVEAGASFNFNQSYWAGASALDPFQPATYGDHGTGVAGIIAADADNGIGGRGVAPSAQIRGYNMLAAVDNYGYFASLGASDSQPDSTDVDIFNMSFGVLGGEYDASAQEKGLFQNGVNRLRSGRGAIYVKSAGNGFGRCNSMLREAEVEVGREDTDADGVTEPVYVTVNINDEIGCVPSTSLPSQNLPYLIPIAAFSANGERSSYSSAGSNIWVSAPAGEFGVDDPAQITTDQMGGGQGYDAFFDGLTFAGAQIPVGSTENPHGDYINSFNGTSAAAPNASGAIALLLEAQPQLTWRDVKYILARTARKIHADIPEVKVGFGGAAAMLRHAWTTNAAGYHYHNWYGFGAIAVDEAITLARSHTPDGLGDFRDGQDVFRMAESLSIPDHNGAGVTQSINVSGLDAGLEVEAVQLHIRATHPFTNDLGIYLVSPSGTESLLNPPFNEVLTGDRDLDWTLLSNAFYGESPGGDWTLKVVDVAAGHVGTLDSWALTFYLGDIPGRE